MTQLHLTITAAAPSADPAARTITGIAATYGVTGVARGGLAFRVAPGAIHVPDDPTRVKLLIQHDKERAAGYLTAAADTPAGLKVEFAAAAGPHGDDALAGIAARTRNGLSVGMVATNCRTGPDGVTEVLCADLREVSLVTVPALPDSWADTPAPANIAASQEVPVDTETTTTATEETPDSSATTEQRPQTPDDAPAAPSAPVVLTGADAAAASNTNADAVTVQASAAQGTGPAHTRSRSAGGPRQSDTLADVVRLIQARAEAGQVNTIEAALADITPTSLGNDKGVMRPTWLGELWKARRVERPIIDMLNKRALTSTRIQGFEWVSEPKVDKYAGEKAEIPTNTFTLQEVEKKPQRFAGGWDVDRVYVDLGDGAFVEEILRRAYDDYLLDTEAFAAAEIVAAATAVTAANVPALLVKMAAQVRPLGGTLSKFVLSSDLFEALLNTAETAVPWWMKAAMSGSASVGVMAGEARASDAGMTVDPGLPAGTMIALDRRAATWFEAPVQRVRAIDVPKGGIDVALFGYGGVLVEDKRVILKGTIGA